ncbi:MAG: MEDS domain-containing protein [Pirellulaceae bacterium]
MIYDNLHDQMAAAVPFISQGIACGDRCIYIADDRTIEEVRIELAAAGLDIDEEVRRGALQLLTKQDAYLRTGTFEPAAMIEFLRAAVAEACADGFAGFRVTGEMTWALGGEAGCDRVIEYEAMLNEFFPGSRALAICQYNRLRFAPRVIQDVLRTHPRAVLGRQVCSNLYYEPPDLVLHGDRDQQRVDWMIQQLELRQQEIVERERVEASLRESEQRFSGFMQHLPGLAWIKDAEGRYIFANDAAVEAFRTPRSLLYGKTDQDVFPPATASAFREHDLQALATNSGIQVIETLEHANGREHQSLVAKFPIPARDGTTTLIGGVAIDVTEQKNAEKAVRDSERIYRAIGESIDFGVWVCDPSGRNIYASESLLKLIGMTQDQCCQFGWVDALHPDDAERTAAAWRECVRTRGTWDNEHRFRGVDGRYYPVLARGAPVVDEQGNVIYWAGINLDISRIKTAEESLRETDRRKDEFLAMLAHELRNPLAPIRSGLDVLSLGDVAPEVVDLMRRQVEQLVRLVDDLLDVSRIMRGKVNLRRELVELAQVVARASETARPLIDAQHHRFTRSLPAEPVWIDGDPVRLAQVFSNLLANSAKYTEYGGQIALTAQVEEDEVVIRVRDSGIGIDAELLPHVFELFTQSERAIDRSQGGLGIGLTVSKSLVEMHGGSIAATSAGHGKGSEFVVRLPLVRRAERPLLRHVPSPPCQRRRILVVDDNAAAAKMLSLLLRKMGPHHIELAHDGPRALELARDFQPDIVLLDIGLPRMSGYEVAQQLRELPRSSPLLLVALTGYGSDEDRRRSQLAGFDEHLIKPPALESLQQLLAHPVLAAASQPRC